MIQNEYGFGTGLGIKYAGAGRVGKYYVYRHLVLILNILFKRKLSHYLSTFTKIILFIT